MLTAMCKKYKRHIQGDEMKQSTANCISVHQKFNRTIWTHPLGNEFDMVRVCVRVRACVPDGG